MFEHMYIRTISKYLENMHYTWLCEKSKFLWENLDFGAHCPIGAHRQFLVEALSAAKTHPECFITLPDW